MGNTKLSREALEAAPWAAHLAASFPSEAAKTGMGAGKLQTATATATGDSGRARPLTWAEIEEEVSRETATLLAARAASSSAAVASTSSSSSTIPTFFRPKNAASYLSVELRSAAHRVALQYKERGLLEDEELEDLWNCITSVIGRRVPEPSTAGGGRSGGLLGGLPPIAAADTAAAADAESRVGYEVGLSVNAAMPRAGHVINHVLVPTSSVKRHPMTR